MGLKKYLINPANFQNTAMKLIIFVLTSHPKETHFINFSNLLSSFCLLIFKTGTVTVYVRIMITV